MLRKAIPVLTHVDNLSDMKIDMSAQEQSLGMIANNTGATNSVVGTTEDADTETTVIGLLKSIVNKLS